MNNQNSLLRKLFQISLIVDTLLLILAAIYFFSGSQELFPTEEQSQKINIVFGLILLLLACFDLALFYFYQKLFKKIPPSATTGIPNKTLPPIFK